MSLKYRDSSGTETPVAGLNGTSGELVPSVALQQSGVANVSMPSTSELTDLFIKTVTFDTPFDDTDYVLNVDQCEVSEAEINRVYDKTTTGFTVAVMYNRKLTEVPSYNVTARIPWTAFKLMTDTVHEADAAHIAQNTANFAPAFSEVTSYAVGDYVTYNNVLYRCTTAHTAGTWVAGHFTQVTVGGDLNAIVPSNANASNKLTTREETWIGRGVLGTATDLNTIVIPGCYDCPDASLLTNAPSGAGRGKLINFYGGDNTMYFSQMYRNIDDGGTWVRSSAGTWSSWQKLVTKNELKTTFGLKWVDEHTCTFDLSLLPYTNNGLCLINLLGNSNLEGSAVCSIGYHQNRWKIEGVNTLVNAGGVGTITASISGTTLTISNTGVHYGGALNVKVGRLF